MTLCNLLFKTDFHDLGVFVRVGVESGEGFKDWETWRVSKRFIGRGKKAGEYWHRNGGESRGFVFASAVSYKLKKPLIMMRKKNKLPADRYSVDFELEYGKATIEVHKDSINKGENILIIDDLIATGGTAEAAAKLVEISGGKIAGFIFIINLFDLGGNQKLKDKSYFTESLIDFPGH